MDHRCPHRCASLFFGRAEGDGIRCVYHGWKFDAEGKCLDHAEPAGRPAVHRSRARPRPTRWPSAAASSGPTWARARSRRRCRRSRAWRCPSTSDGHALTCANATGCRRSRATSTPRISASCIPARVQADDIAADSLHRFGLTDRAPRYHVKDTDWGTMYTAYRPAGAGNLSTASRTSSSRSSRCRPTAPSPTYPGRRLWVPMDDTHTMVSRLLDRSATSRCAR